MAAIQIFFRFLLLGLVSFGGPAAHIGYFQNVFVDKLGWLSREHYAKLVALSQFLPGPGSSQVGFAIGLHRSGLSGGVAAFLGFTLPSFILMLLLAYGVSNYGVSNNAWGHLISGAITGLKLLAVVVVADAVVSMFKSFCNDWQSRFIALVTAAVLLWQGSLLMQISLLGLAGLAGVLIRHNVSDKQHSNTDQVTAKNSKIRIQWLALIVFFALFLGLPFASNWSAELTIFSDFYNAGSLVFGGGHVVLPLLQHSAGDVLTQDQFLTGYAAAQAVPGPMFTLATYLGAQLASNPLVGASIATIALFLPGFLLVLALKNGWEAMLEKPRVAGAAWGINAAVVGLLIAAFYHPVFTSAVNNWQTLLACAMGFLALRLTKCPIVVLVMAYIALGYWL